MWGILVLIYEFALYQGSAIVWAIQLFTKALILTFAILILAFFDLLLFLTIPSPLIGDLCLITLNVYSFFAFFCALKSSDCSIQGVWGRVGKGCVGKQTNLKRCIKRRRNFIITC